MATTWFCEQPPIFQNLRYLLFLFLTTCWCIDWLFSGDATPHTGARSGQKCYAMANFDHTAIEGMFLKGIFYEKIILIRILAQENFKHLTISVWQDNTDIKHTDIGTNSLFCGQHTNNGGLSRVILKTELINIYNYK